MCVVTGYLVTGNRLVCILFSAKQVSIVIRPEMQIQIFVSQLGGVRTPATAGFT